MFFYGYMGLKMNNNKVILVGLVSVVFACSAIMTTFYINEKIEILSKQVALNNTQIESQIKTQGESLRKSLSDISEIRSQVSNITYKPGFIAKLDIPKSVENNLEGIEKTLNTPSEWGGDQVVVEKLNKEFAGVISPMPSWQLEELKPRLYAARWAIDSLQIINEPEATDLDGLTKQVDRIQQQITDKPEALYEDLASTLSKNNQKYLVDGFSMANKYSINLVNSNSQDREQLNKAIYYLNRFSNVGKKSDIDKLTTSIANRVEVIDISSNIDSLAKNLRDIEKTDQSDLVEIAAVQADQSLSSIKLYAFKNNLLSNPTLEAKFEELKGDIEKIQFDIESSSKQKNEQKVKKYQVWALNQIKSVQPKDTLLSENKDSIKSYFDRNNPLSEACKEAEAKTQDELLAEMVDFLSPINQNLLDNAVAQWYQIIYQKRFNELDEQHKLQLVEEFALADKKGLD